jgi:hypothetical protein
VYVRFQEVKVGADGQTVIVLEGTCKSNKPAREKIQEEPVRPTYPEEPVRPNVDWLDFMKRMRDMMGFGN